MWEVDRVIKENEGPFNRWKEFPYVLRINFGQQEPHGIPKVDPVDRDGSQRLVKENKTAVQNGFEKQIEFSLVHLQSLKLDNFDSLD